MPIAVPCIEPGCPELSDSTRCPKHRKERELSRRKVQSGWEWTATANRIKRRDGYRCTEVIDGKRCGSSIELEVDHEVRLELGGTNDDDNLRTRCRDCHLRRHGKRRRA
jgi:5-methylcytosine-specific restriction protein A